VSQAKSLLAHHQPGKKVVVELKNDVNVKLLNVKVVNQEKYPQLCTLQNCFIRGSVVRYIQIPPEHVDTELLQDAARKENAPAAKAKPAAATASS